VTDSPSPTRSWPRRLSEAAAWTFLAGILIVGLPLFVCMPLWVDTTYHDLSARNILRGGVHYRDIFETNLPGMVWLTALVRALVGWSSEAIRIADLVVVGGTIVLLGLFVRKRGVSRSGMVWYVAAASFFYVYETEFIHCQRDSWMLLPTVAALCLRRKQLVKTDAKPRMTYGRAVLEGALWGCAVWIKPHCVVPALFVWVTSLGRLRGAPRVALADFLGLLTGGALVGGAGSAWLLATGTWPWMWDVLLDWNREYYNWSLAEMDFRASMVIMYFAPWSLAHLAAIPLAVVALVRARVWRIGVVDGVTPERVGRALLAALYLGWLAEATFLQKTFHYSQAPVLLLALALLASYRWPSSQVLIAWCLIGGALHHYREKSPTLDKWLGAFRAERKFTYQQVVPWNKLINGEWREVWWRCVREGSSPEIKEHLSFYRYNHCAPTWTELDEVRKFLQTLDLKDGDLVCWDDSPHPLYLDLDLRPSFRFLHVNTALDSFISKRPRIRDELMASGHKYVVSDLAVLSFLYEFPCPAGHDLELPEQFPCFCRDVYPWNQPIIFRTGRYCVHKVEKPITDIRIPHPARMDRP
jgi:hypothetical protein